VSTAAAGTLLFDGAAAPLDELWIGLAILAVAALLFVWRLSGRSMPWFFPIGLALFGIIVTGSLTWDTWRIRSMLASGDGLQVTQGAIDQVWHVEERRRDLSQSNPSRYKTVIGEGFDIGPQRFSWQPGSCLSGAALCNLKLIHPPLEKGMTVEVTWFKDDAQNGDNRVVRLRALPAPSQNPIHGESK